MLHIVAASRRRRVCLDISNIADCRQIRPSLCPSAAHGLLAFPLDRWWWLRSPNNSNNARNVNNNGNLNNNNVNNNNAVAPGFPLFMASCLANRDGITCVVWLLPASPISDERNGNVRFCSYYGLYAVRSEGKPHVGMDETWGFFLALGVRNVYLSAPH